MQPSIFCSVLFPIFIILSTSVGFAGVPAAEVAAPHPDNGPSWLASDTLTEYFFGKNNCLDAEYDKAQQWKKDNHLPFYFGADHWFHVDRDEKVYGNGYGVPGERGTYYYYAEFDPSLTFADGGFVREIGAHVQGRIRDSEEKLRSFYRENYWSYESYAYAKTKYGVVKGGQIALQFGYGWDNSWWEGIPYFDGYRFNPAYGFSWENTWKISKTINFDTAFQYFIADDRVSGSIRNADAESSLAGERNTFVLRAAPSWTPNADTKVVVGASFLTREIHHPGKFGLGVLDDGQTAWSVDGAVTWKNLTVFSQYTDSFGVISPTRYVSGGPSDRQNSVEVGALYKFGPISPRVNFSKGWDHNPGGSQYILNPGVTINVAKSLTLFVEYVKWNVKNRDGVKSVFDDGFELIAVWNY